MAKELFIKNDLPPWLQPVNSGDVGIYTEYTWKTLMERLSGGEPLRAICEEPGMPSYAKLLHYIYRTPERKKEYEFAQQLAAEAMIDEMREIAEDKDLLEDVHRTKLRLEVRKFIVQSWNKEKYAPGQRNETNVNVNIVDAMSSANERLERHRGEIVDAEIVDAE